ncbi:MAG TPA: aldo/keto reductase [Kofleriaceae bacterium]
MIGLGCMRLSTDADRDDQRSAEVLDAAIAAGIDLLDTADAYALDDSDAGHNERLVAAAVARAGKPVQIVTKGGLERPGGAWVPNGRARHLAAAARASRDRLGTIDLYLLHAVDPKTPLATSVRALARLRDDGIARGVGLSNVGPAQLEEALALTAIDAIEIELHPWKLDAIRGGLVELCAARDIRVLAYRPLGGPAGVKRAARDPLLRELAEQHAATPAEIVLAWLRSLSPVIVPIPGATRIVTAQSAARSITLDAAAGSALRARFLAVASTTRPERRDDPAGRRDDDAAGDRPDSHPRRHDDAARGRPESPPDRREDAEIVLILGMPAAGKSTLAADYEARGFLRLNRDDRGGSLLDLARALDGELANGATRLVVDNTYATRASRAPIIEVARQHDATVRCIVVATTIQQAQAHAVARMLERNDRLLEPRELRSGEIGPGAQFRWRREYEPPRIEEGFVALEEHAPVRAITGTRLGLIVELDHVMWIGKPSLPDKIVLVDGVRDVLAPFQDHVLAGTLWRPGIEPGAVDALATRLGELLDRAIDVRACPHPAGPPVCWCRKPLPGLALALARTHDLDLARSTHLGRNPADRGFALRAGMQYRER